MEPEKIVIRGAREHNLKNITVEIPKKKLVLLTGVSGSGKSSLAFDTLFAEGQRRYVESLSAYARQFLGQLEKPHYDTISGLSPTIAIEQKAASNNPRSTVGTITEIYDYQRVLFARVGQQHCYQCGKPVSPQSPQQIADEVMLWPERSKLVLMAPLVENRKGEHQDLLDTARKAGFIRVMINGEQHELAEELQLDKKKKHTIQLVVDRIVLKPEVRSRLNDSIETCLTHGKGTMLIQRDGGEQFYFSEHNACVSCGISFPPLTPQLFSFNNPQGMCAECNGLGTTMTVAEKTVVPDPTLSIRDGAIEPWSKRFETDDSWTLARLTALCDELEIDMAVPFGSLPDEHKEVLLYGYGKRVSVPRRSGRGVYRTRYEGICHVILRRYKETTSDAMRQQYQKYFQNDDCPSCSGSRLRPEARAVFIGGRSIDDLNRSTIEELHHFFCDLSLSGNRKLIAEEIVKEIQGRLQFLMNVGLDYLTMNRSGPTLSGGESQRIRLASQLGSELSGVVYVLDEPSIGLHQRDNRRLIETLERMRDIGNTVVVVEHDQETIEHADHVIDFGPGAGRLGGDVVFSGTLKQLKAHPSSLTGGYLSGRHSIPIPPTRRAATGFLTIRGANENNLKDIDVSIPLGVLTVVTGVSGAGKSSLVRNILYPALTHRVNRAASSRRIGGYRTIEGWEAIDKVVNIDQKPIGRTPRSNPATYTKVFDLIREVFAQTPDARMFGYKAGRFSFNVKGGRCENCGGAGVIQIEMHFLADVYVPCEVCGGKRYNHATLKVHFKGRSICGVLDATVDEVAEMFTNHPNVIRVLRTLQDVGLGYMPLGQSSTTLSGGEAQRIKLSRELAKRSTGKTFYILDEPTTGLHFDDIRKLLTVVQRLVAAGNSVLIIEHNLDVIKCADHVIDLGPEGGHRGGEIVANGSPEAICQIENSYTGQFLRSILSPTRRKQKKAI